MSLELEIIAFAASLIGVSGSLPQIIKIIKTKETKAISYNMYFMLILGSCLWITYGIRAPLYAIVFWNIIAIFTYITVMALKFKVEHKELFENKFVIKANIRYPVYAALLTISAFTI